MQLDKSKIKLLFQNRDTRGLIGNFFYLSLLKVLSFVFPLITLPYLTRVIGVEKFGAIAFATAVIVIVETVEAGSCKVISHVMTGDNPVTPNITKNTLLTTVAGLMVSIIVIALRSLFKEKRLVDDNDIQKYFDVPVLGVIPEVEGDHS